MRSLYLGVVFLHVLAALVWVGGMLFFALVAAPAVRNLDPPVRAALVRTLGERFRLIGWACIAILVVTGVANLAFHGVLDGPTLRSAAFWGTPYGRALGWKLGGVGAMLTLSAVHDFVHGPRASRLPLGSPEALRARGRAILLARANALLVLVAIWAAVRLARGG